MMPFCAERSSRSSAPIPQNLMQEANYRVDRDSDKETPAAAGAGSRGELGLRSD